MPLPRCPNPECGGEMTKVSVHDHEWVWDAWRCTNPYCRREIAITEKRKVNAWADARETEGHV